MTDDGKTSTEKSGLPALSVSSTRVPVGLLSRLDAAIKGEVTLFPIRVLSETEYVNLAKVLQLSRNVGIAQTFVSFQMKEKKAQDRLVIMPKLKAICAPLNAVCYVISSRPGRLLTCVLYSRQIISLEVTPLDGG